MKPLNPKDIKRDKKLEQRLQTLKRPSILAEEVRPEEELTQEKFNEQVANNQISRALPALENVKTRDEAIAMIIKNNPMIKPERLGRMITDRLRAKNSFAEGKLVGGQKKLDMNKDGDLDEQDFKMLRNKKNYGGTMSLLKNEETRQPFVFGKLVRAANKAGLKTAGKAEELDQRSAQELLKFFDDQLMNEDLNFQLKYLKNNPDEISRLDADEAKDILALEELRDISKNPKGGKAKFIGQLLQDNDGNQITAKKFFEDFLIDFGDLADDMPVVSPPPRLKRQEGGSLLQDEMEAMEDMESDEDMEENYMGFLINEALNEDEEAMLMKELKANPELNEVFDKVMEVAMEFSGSGPVEGPGSEVSDSIPARLSDGEFVFTAKSVEEIGVDKLTKMMEDAEDKADERQKAQMGGMMKSEEELMLETDDQIGEELKKLMLSGKTPVRS